MSRPHYTTVDIIHAVSKVYYERGKDYFQKGKVKQAYFDDGLLIGKVSGSRTYKQYISFKGEQIIGECSCPVGYNCKHVAAVLLSAMNTLQQDSVKSFSDYIMKEETIVPGTYSSNEIDYYTKDWLNGINLAIGNDDISNRSASQNKELSYILKVDNGIVKVAPYTVSFKKDGSYSKSTKPYNIDNIASKRKIPNYIDLEDQFILQQIYKTIDFYVPPESGYKVSNSDLFVRILNTGKCVLEELKGIALKRGDTKSGVLQWEMKRNGSQGVTCNTDSGDDIILKLSEPWYVDRQSGACGELRCDMPMKVAGAILSAPDIDPSEVETVRNSLSQYSSNVVIPLPSTFKKKKIIKESPTPHLTLMGKEITIRNYWGNETNINVAIAKVSFDYGGTEVLVSETSNLVNTIHENVLIQYQRDRKSELKAIDRLHDYGLLTLDKYHGGFQIISDVDDYRSFPFDSGVSQPVDEWMVFIANGVPALDKQDWKITFDPSFPYHITRPDNDWYANLDDSSGTDWFELELGVSIDGKRKNLLPILLAALNNGSLLIEPEEPDENKESFLPLPDGSMLALPARRIWTIMSCLKDLYGFHNLGSSGSLRVSRHDLAEVSAIEEVTNSSDMNWHGGEKLRELGKKIRNFAGVSSVEPSKKCKAVLREYQREGLNWMQFLREYSLGGILADDMGLGKTVQALSYVMREKEDGRLTKPILVVCPTSVLVNWSMEVERFTPSLNSLTLHGSERKNRFAEIEDSDIVMTTYPLLTRDKEILLEQDFHTVILDEAQYIKNPKAKNNLVACQLKTDNRICMTGTPVENHLGELWAQFNFLMPGFLGDEKQFRQFFRNPIEREGNNERNKALVRRIKPFVMRRTKDEISDELPPKTIICRTASLDKAQRDLYETIRISMHKKVRDEIENKGLARSHIVVLDALLKMRQVCCDPRLLKMDAAKKVSASAKLDLLMELLPEMVEEGRKILIFSQFVSMLKLIESELKNAKIKFVKITGQTKDRKTPIEAFQGGKADVFLISLKAGGTGLNLTAADTVIHYDPWWNPAVESQATDRAHRMGQEKPVFVYKLLTAGTVEEKIMEMQERKRGLAEGIFNPDSNTSDKISAEDINVLFEPLQ